MKALLALALTAAAIPVTGASPLEGELLDAPGPEYRNMARDKGLFVEWIRNVRFVPDEPRRVIVGPRSLEQIRASLESQRGAYSSESVLSRPVRMDSITPQE